MLGLSRLWFTAGAVLLFSFFVIGYHQDQQLANQTLAEKIGLPLPVPVQEFSALRDTNALNETFLIGEANIDTLSLLVTDEDESLLLLSIFALSNDGRAKTDVFMNMYAGGPSVGAPGEVDGTGQVERNGKEMVEAVLVFDTLEESFQVPSTFLSDRGIRILGTGNNGSILAIPGAIIEDTMWSNKSKSIADWISNNAITLDDNTVPFVAPFRLEDRVPPVSNYEATRELHFVSGLALIVIGFLVSFSPSQVFERRPTHVPGYKVTGSTDERIASYFQPIATQDELLFNKHDLPQETPTSWADDASDALRRMTKSIAVFKSRP
ncbi:MAG: hypothetical protein OXQ30_12375 [Boseongicola sp.]|nr:hypothetical protein [Boseongicola sp.]